MIKKLKNLSEGLIYLNLKKEASAVSALNWISRSPYFSEIDVGHFLSTNSEELDKIDRLAGSRFFSSRSGGEGTAYFIGDNGGSPRYVLKINFLGSYHKLFEDSKWEAKVIDYGILSIKYLNGKDKNLTWKVIEKLDTNGVEGSGIQDIIDIVIQSISDIYKEILKSKETLDWKKDQISVIPVDVLSPEVIGTILEFYNESGLNLVQDLKENVLKEIGSIDGIESEIPSLADGWFDDFIESIVRLLSESKNDFGEGNVGVREETGKLIWFDV
jgi:hypothetical protein